MAALLLLAMVHRLTPIQQSTQRNVCAWALEDKDTNIGSGRHTNIDTGIVSDTGTGKGTGTGTDVAACREAYESERRDVSKSPTVTLATPTY